MSDQTGKADWQGVGDSFRVLGRRLKDHAVGAGDAISSANDGTSGSALDQVSAVFTAAVAKLDETATDPEVGAATRNATARLLDAIKAELTGETSNPNGPAPDEPGPPEQVEPGPNG
jgi:hypothetical protein